MGEYLSYSFVGKGNKGHGEMFLAKLEASPERRFRNSSNIEVDM
jgi:hypothetical protein